LKRLQKIKFFLSQVPFIYPKKIHHSCAEWIKQRRNKLSWYYSIRDNWNNLIFEEEFHTISLPLNIKFQDKKYFDNYTSYKTAASSIFYLKYFFCYSTKPYILNKEHELFQEFSHHFNIDSLKRYLYKNPFLLATSSYKKIEGTAAVLISPESHNYYHWLNDVLPRIKLYEPFINLIDYFLVSEDVPHNYVELLSAFNIPLSKILRVGKKEKIFLGHLYISSLPGSEGRSPLWAINFIRNTLISKFLSTENEKVKLYLKRGNVPSRKVINEDEIMDYLIANGFQILDPGLLSIPEQVRIFQNASTVISAHGAGLTNLLFVPKDCKVIELFSTDYFRTDCYFTLSGLRKLPYWYIVGEKTNNGSWGDIRVNVQQLDKVIKASYNDAEELKVK
jgi:hypothetical protein